MNSVNEPASEDEDFPWERWRPYGEQLIAVIRGHSEAIIRGPGPYWTSDLSQIPEGPYSDDNVVYVAHIYPGSLDPGDDQETEWELRFGSLADTYPVMVSEWGFHEGGDEVTNGTLEGYAEPPMVELDWATLTEFGRLVQDELRD